MTDDHDRILALEKQVRVMAETIGVLTKATGVVAVYMAATDGRLKAHSDEITAITVRLPREPKDDRTVSG